MEPVAPYPEAWPAPAKLNLMLRIMGRRSDGYHLLQTVFQFLDYCDWLHFDIRHDSCIKRKTDIPDVPEATDLTVHAARLLQQVTGSSQGVNLHISKHLPMGGGLGGGSSDAATTLVALNHYWQTGLSTTALATLALQLGADVPVFVQGQAAWAEGVGEQLTPIILDEPWFVVLTPPCQIATGTVFNDPELTRNSPPIKIADFLSGIGGNDCEAVIYRRYPEVAEMAGRLARHGEVRLTGTGACLFMITPDKISAKHVLKQLPPEWSSFVARGCNHSPLHERLMREHTIAAH